MQQESKMLKQALEREISSRESLERLVKEKESDLQDARQEIAQLKKKLETQYDEQMEELLGSKRKLEKTYQNLAALIRNLQAGILVEDETRHIVLANQRFCDLFHIPAPPEAIAGMDCSQSAEQSKMLFNDPELFVRRITKILKERQLVLAEELDMVDGRVLERDYIPVYTESGEYLGHLWQYKDVTERIQAERALRKAKQKAERSSKARETFLANISHEIRTPMNAILGMTELLLGDQVPPRQREQLVVVQKSAENLLILINDLLDITKIDSGKLRLEKIAFRIEELLEYIIKTLDVGAQRKQIRLEYDCDPNIPEVLISDPHRVNQILTNLVNNAIKFTKEGSVNLSARLIATASQQAQIEFKIVDTGIGIAQDQLKAIFESFQQADESITRRFGGTGLGLTISRKLTELLGGEIAVQSEPGVGTTFTLTLPMEIGSHSDMEEVADPAMHPEGSLKGKRVLLVEDHEYNQILTVSFLDEWGVEHSLAHNGQQALDILREHRFDLILMDIQMPVMDGLEATKAIRNELGLNLPILALSATAQQSEADRCIIAGMDDFLSKPFSRTSLFQKLASLLPPAQDSAVTGASPSKPTSFDFDLLLQHVNGNPNLAKRLVKVFVDSAPREAQLLREAGQEGKLEDAREILHRIRPSLKMMGMKSILQKMDQINQLDEGERDRLKKLTEEIAQEILGAASDMSDMD